MTRKERHLVYKLIGLALTGLGLAFTVPSLINEHDTIALLAAGLLSIAWAGAFILFLVDIFDRVEKGR